jgi:hypothetical protein
VAGGGAIPAGELLQVVKAGVDNVLGLSSTKLRLGVIDDFTATDRPPASGYHVGIAAPEKDIPESELWIRGGRLVRGAAPPVAKGYTGHDYLVINVQATERRDDWPGLPAARAHNDAIAAAMMDTTTDVAAKRQRLNDLWPGFMEGLIASDDLTRRDAECIASDVRADLQKRLMAMTSGSPFETKAFGETYVQDPAAFDFAMVPPYPDAPVPKAGVPFP